MQRQVPTLSGAVDVASGTGSCARLSDATLECWGGVEAPQPWGADEYDYADPPLRSIPLDHVAQVTIGDYTAFALRDDGTVFEFTFGLGKFPIEPFEVADLAGATHLFATPWDNIIYSEGIRRGEYVAALFADGRVSIHSAVELEAARDDGGAPLVSADGGYQTQLGQSGNFRSALPLGDVAGAQGARLVAAAEMVLCVVIGDDEVLCEGDNTFGQLGRDGIGGAEELLMPVVWPLEPGTSR